jgi:parallel beta-helix repeat protein
MEAKNVDDAEYAAIKAQETFNNPECVGAIPLIWHWDPPIEVVNNTISDNNLANNLCGINLVSSSQNLIYQNNFVNNSRQPYSNASINAWHGGYPSGGNYWSDYTGLDLHRGLYQNETGSDGIGDTPYFIAVNNQDRYPLMKPYGGPYDIGITSIIPSKTVVGQGYSLGVSVKIVNYGINAETFNLTLYANTSVFQSLTDIGLTSRNSTVITFTWNTTGFAKGNYTISAYANTVSGETDTIDNTLTDGIMTVTIPGDVDGDKDVDLYDVVRICSVYGSKKGDPKYDVNCDVNGDDKIDLYDVVIACARYGERV